MIKKILLGLGLSFISIIGFSNAETFKVYEIGLDGYTSFLDSNYSNTYLKKGRFLTNYLGTSKSVIALGNNNMFWWGSNGMLYLFDNNSVGLTQGFFNYYQSCDEISSLNDTSMNNCGSAVSFNGQSSEVVSNFLNKIDAGDYVSIYRNDRRAGCGGYCTYQRFDENICFSSSVIGKSLCFVSDISSYCPSNGSAYCSSYPLTNSQGLSSNITFSNLPYSFIGDSPGILNNSFDGGTGSFNNSGNIQLISDDVNSVINFFESRYGFNQNICYVGTDDLDTEYGSGNLFFELGTGGTIFSLYRKFYSGTDLKDIGTFINVRQLNYNQWFNVRSTDENSFFLASWDGPGTSVKVLYNDLEFPFMGKPAALYFMSNYIFNSSPEFQMGDEIATYCFAKLNKDNLSNGSVDFTEYWGAVPDYVKGIVNTYSNYTIGSSVGFSKPDTDGGENNMRNIILNTGNSIPEDLSPTTLFVGFYNRITSLVQNYNPRFDPLLPLWIIYPLIFLILFRMLRH